MSETGYSAKPDSTGVVPLTVGERVGPLPNIPEIPVTPLISPEVTTWTTASISAADILQTPNYKFNEGNLLQELKEYIDGTYRTGHYSRNKFQATEFILDSGHGVGFCIGNILKYAQRYGKKSGYNRKDILKILHYALILLATHDQEHGEVAR
jgi:hypothetical protein